MIYIIDLIEKLKIMIGGVFILHCTPHYPAAILTYSASSHLRIMVRNSKPSASASADSGPLSDTLDVSGLADEWDQCDDIRDRLRDGQGLIDKEAVLEDVRGCVISASLLVPILTRMSLKESKPLPPITELRVEIEKVFLKNKRVQSPELVDEVVKASWRVKKFCGFVKMKTRREEVSTVTRTKLKEDF